jgi:hypothetical protein
VAVLAAVYAVDFTDWFKPKPFPQSSKSVQESSLHGGVK